MHLRTRQINTLDPAVQQHLGWLCSQLEGVFLVIFILNMDRKPNAAELFILGPSMASMALSRVARQRMVASVIITTTPEWRTGHYKETCTETSERMVPVVVKFTWIWAPIVVLRTSQIFVLSGSSRPDSGNCHERDGACTDNTSPYAHFFSLRTLARQMSCTFGLRALTICSCASQVIFIIGNVFVDGSFDFVSSKFLITYCLPDGTYRPPTPLTGFRPNPCANSSLGWTVWPSGPSDPKHRLRAQVLHRCQ